VRSDQTDPTLQDWPGGAVLVGLDHRWRGRPICPAEKEVGLVGVVVWVGGLSRKGLTWTERDAASGVMAAWKEPDGLSVMGTTSVVRGEAR
jgi:hypothetical protein